MSNVNVVFHFILRLPPARKQNMIKAKKDEHNIVSLKVIKKRILPMSNVNVVFHFILRLPPALPCCIIEEKVPMQGSQSTFNICRGLEANA